MMTTERMTMTLTDNYDDDDDNEDADDGDESVQTHQYPGRNGFEADLQSQGALPPAYWQWLREANVKRKWNFVRENKVTNGAREGGLFFFAIFCYFSF